MSVTLNKASGTFDAASETIAAVEYQKQKVVDGTIGGTTPLIVTASGAAKVDGSGVTQPTSSALGAKEAKQDDQITLLTAQASMLDGLETLTGAVNETAPASDTASSGANGRLQRIAQRITSLIALLPTALGGNGGLKSDMVSINGVTPLMGAGATGAGSPRVTLADESKLLSGNVAHDAADSGNPVKIGGIARQANPTAVTALDRVDGMYDDLGRQVVVTGHVRDLVSHQHTQIVSSSAETTIVTATAAEFHDLVCLVITNQTATSVNVTIKDSTTGTTRMIIALAASGGAVIPFPIPLPQIAAVNNTWTATLSSAAVTVNIFAQFVKNV